MLHASRGELMGSFMLMTIVQAHQRGVVALKDAAGGFGHKSAVGKRVAVYVYENPEMEAGFERAERERLQVCSEYTPGAKLEEGGHIMWGDPVHSEGLPFNYYDTSMHCTRNALYAALRTGSAYLTEDPAAADIFLYFVTSSLEPFYTFSKEDEAWVDSQIPDTTYVPPHRRFLIRKECKFMHELSLQKAMKLLPHLTTKTYAKHFVLTEYASHNCQREGFHGLPKMEQMFLSFSSDSAEPRKPFRNVPYTAAIHLTPKPKAAVGNNPVDDTGSNIAVGATPPWKSTHRRPHLISFIGSTNGDTRWGSGEIRVRIKQQCDKVDDAVCWSSKYEVGTFVRVKFESVFCLEPPGYSEYRKSIVDSYLAGCIPVFFLPPEVYDGSQAGWAAQWGNWQLNSSSLNVAMKYTKNSGVVDTSDLDFDVITMLQSVSPAQIESLQASLRANAHTLMYGEGYYEGDAISVILQALRAEALGRGREYVKKLRRLRRQQVPH